MRNSLFPVGNITVVAAAATADPPTGKQRRPALLRDLWRAQQPPGRLSRALPRLQKLLGRTLVVVGLVAVGFVLGHNAQQGWGSGGGGPRRVVEQRHCR